MKDLEKVMTGTASSSRGFTDVHVHLYDKRFGATPEEVAVYLERARSHGVVRFVCATASPADWNRTADLARRFPGVYPSFGVHPWNCKRVSDGWLAPLANFLDGYVANDGNTKAALGEVGLDFAVRDCTDELRDAQEKMLRDQLKLADERKIPVTLHSVRANERVLDIMRDYRNVPAWLLHGWRATTPEIERAVELGAFFSFSARSVAANALASRECVAKVPRDRILLESDGPTQLPPNGYMLQPGEKTRQTVAPQFRDDDGFLLAEPASLLKTASEVAKIRRAPVDEFFRQLSVNERRFFANWPKKDKE